MALLVVNNLRLILKDRKMSQMDLVRQMTVKNKETVSRWVNNKQQPQDRYVREICTILKVTPNELFYVQKTPYGEI